MNALVAAPPDVLLVQTTLIKQFERPRHFFDAIEITGWSSRQPRNDAEVSIDIGIGGRILSDFIAGDYLDDFLSIRFCWLRHGWRRTTLFRVSRRRYCKSGNCGNQLSFINGSPNGDYKAGSSTQKVARISCR